MCRDVGRMEGGWRLCGGQSQWKFVHDQKCMYTYVAERGGCAEGVCVGVGGLSRKSIEERKKDRGETRGAGRANNGRPGNTPGQRAPHRLQTLCGLAISQPGVRNRKSVGATNGDILVVPAPPPHPPHQQLQVTGLAASDIVSANSTQPTILPSNRMALNAYKL